MRWIGYLVMLLPAVAFGQHRDTVLTDTSYTYRHWFVDSTLSTEYHVNKLTLRGWARAYNEQGQRLLHLPISRNGLRASARFTHYPNGALRAAFAFWQPDGGIQWGEDTWLFDPQGNLLKHDQDGHDRLQQLLAPPVPRSGQ